MLPKCFVHIFYRRPGKVSLSGSGHSQIINILISLMRQCFMVAGGLLSNFFSGLIIRLLLPLRGLAMTLAVVWFWIARSTQRHHHCGLPGYCRNIGGRLFSGIVYFSIAKQINCIKYSYFKYVLFTQKINFF